MTRGRRALFASALPDDGAGLGEPRPRHLSLDPAARGLPGVQRQSRFRVRRATEFAAGQNFVKGHSIAFFDAAGGSLGTTDFGADVTRGADQSHPRRRHQAESQFGFTADTGMATGKLDPSGGAVCWEAFDCVSWGNFHGSANSPTGNPADPLGIPDGMALRRTIAPVARPCSMPLTTATTAPVISSTLSPLPAPTRSFPPSVPLPRLKVRMETSHKASPVEAFGASASDHQFAVGQVESPEDRTPTFSFTSSRSHSVFFCKLDKKRFRRCRSSFTTPRLAFGRHLLGVRSSVRRGACPIALRPFGGSP